MTKRELSWKRYFLFHKDRCLKMSLPGETMSTWRLEMRAGVEPTPDWQHSLCEVLIRFVSNAEKWYFFCELWQYSRRSQLYFEGVWKWQWWRSGCVLPFCHQLLWKKGGRGEGNYNQTKKRSGKNTQNCHCVTLDKRNSSQSEKSVQLSGRNWEL